MLLTRRDFLKWATASAAALGLSSIDLGKLEQAMAATTSPPVIWLQASACTGCTIMMLNAADPTVDDVLLNTISMKYHPNLSAAAGELAVSSIIDTSKEYDGDFILCIEGAIPTGVNGNYCVIGDRDGAGWTVLDAVRELGPKAKYVLAVGTCAAYGGVVKPSEYTGIKSVQDILGGSTQNEIINLPACPAHPNTLLGTIVTLLTAGMPRLDGDNRPAEYYPTTVHRNCPRRHSSMASQVGDFGCYRSLGCNGPETIFSCPLMKWNNGVNWCIDKANMLCIGCASPNFPEGPFYQSRSSSGGMMNNRTTSSDSQQSSSGMGHTRTNSSTTSGTTGEQSSFEDLLNTAIRGMHSN